MNDKGPRGIRRDTGNGRPPRADRREIVADAAALLRWSARPSFQSSKIPPMESSIVPITKQLKSVTDRPVPAPRRCGPRAGSEKSSRGGVEAVLPLGRGFFSTAASALAIRRHVSSTDTSTGRAVRLLQTILHVPRSVRRWVRRNGSWRASEIGFGLWIIPQPIEAVQRLSTIYGERGFDGTRQPSETPLPSPPPPPPLRRGGKGWKTFSTGQGEPTRQGARRAAPPCHADVAEARFGGADRAARYFLLGLPRA